MTHRTVRSYLAALVAAAIIIALAARFASADFPKPSPFPISWELTFEHGEPRRVVVDIPGAVAPKAYWYMTYSVTNNTDKEQVFLPRFELLTRDGRVYPSDRGIPAAVFAKVKQREGNRFLEPFTSIGGTLRVGEDEAKDGVAIWEEPMPRMGNFTIFVSGLNGETVTMKDAQGNEMKGPDGRPIILRKTLQLDYNIPGDERFPGDDPVKLVNETWVMR
jgi:hypothetical protein